jgi:uncharacterized protein YjbI with pentapeptide repeats
MADNYIQEASRFDEIIPGNTVAMIRQELDEISQLNELEFRESHDNLDYLTFVILSLPSNSRVALVRHQSSPESGTEIYVSHHQQNVLDTIAETLNQIKLTPEDLTWVHPDYKEIYKSRESPIPLKAENQPKNFSGIDFSKRALKEAQLEGANLSKSIFNEAELGKANLQGANLQEAILIGTSLREANLQRADLRKANLQRADLREANLQGADLREANLQGADLREANLELADLQNIDWNPATMWFHVIGLHKAKGIPEDLKKQPNYEYYIKLSEGIEQFKQGNLEEFQKIYKQVLVELKDQEIIASLWNKIAWLTVLHSKHSDPESYRAALKAVELKPDQGNYHDTLGMVLALQKDFSSAIKEFEITLKSQDVQKWTEDFKHRRERWLKSLKAGENPFTTEELKILLDIEY